MVTFEQLEETAIPIGGRLVGELGGFLPFAVVANTEGVLEQYAADVGKRNPTSTEVYEFLIGALSAGVSQGLFSAVAIVLHEQPPPEYDIPEDKAIHAYIEINGTGALSVFVPYAEDATGELRIGNIVRVEREPQFFAPIG